MAVILNIDTATNACSVALAVDGKTVISRTKEEGRSHSELLGVFIDEVITEAEKQSLKPEAIAISAGPGSYTGLRIGASLAKGLCFGYQIPLIAIDTLKLLAHTVIRQKQYENALFCSMIDARRMEVYSEIFNEKLASVRPIKAEVIDGDSFSEYLDKQKVIFFGDGAAKCKETIQHANAIFVDDVLPLATNLTELSEQAFNANKFEDTAYYEPLYLKNFVVIPSKKDVLGLGKK